MRYLGCHVSCAGGLSNAIVNAKALGVNAIQIHPSPPQRWVSQDFPDNVSETFNQARVNSGVEKIFFHGIYLINLANPDKQKFHLSKISLVYYLNLLEKIKGNGVIFHVGSFKDTTEKEGFERIIYGINWILNESKTKVPLILEMAAGSGHVVGSNLDELARIYEGVEQKDRVAFALDTQHMWASGYDWVNKLDETVEKIDQVLGLGKVLAIHLNDSKMELASKKDRHENLGTGLIGESGMRAIINHPKLVNIPMILETPGLKSPETAINEVKKLQSWANM